VIKRSGRAGGETERGTSSGRSGEEAVPVHEFHARSGFRFGLLRPEDVPRSASNVPDDFIATECHPLLWVDR